MAKKFEIESKFTAKDDVAQAMEKMGRAAEAAGRHGEAAFGKISHKAHETEGFLSSFKDKFKEAFSFGGAMALGGRAADFMVDKVKEVAKALPEFAEKAEGIGRTAAKLGIATDAFQELSYAAKMADVSQESFEKSMQKMNAGMGLLAKHQGPMEAGLKSLNPALMMQLRTAKDSKEAFLDVAAAIQKSPNAMNRAALATAVFGKAGQEMLPLLMQGKEGIKGLTEEAHIYSNIMGKETIEAGGSFSDSVKKIKSVLGALDEQVLGKLLAKVTPIIESMAKWLGQNKEMIGQGINKTFEVLANVFGKIGPSIERIGGTVLPMIGRTLTTLGPIFQTVFETGAALIEGLIPVIDSAVAAFAGMAPIINDVAKLIKGVLTPVFAILKPIVEVFFKELEVGFMVWSQTIGRVLEFILRTAADVGKAFGMDTSGLRSMADSLVDLRESSTAAVFGKHDPSTADKRQNGMSDQSYRTNDPYLDRKKEDSPVVNKRSEAMGNKRAEAFPPGSAIQAYFTNQTYVDVSKIPGASATVRHAPGASLAPAGVNP